MNEKSNELLEEILLWTKYDYLATKQKMIEHLDTDDKKIAYQKSNGERSSRDIAKLVSVSYKTIQKWWKKWFDLGLMEQTEKYGGSRYKQLISLTKMGIPIPDISTEEVEDEQR